MKVDQVASARMAGLGSTVQRKLKNVSECATARVSVWRLRNVSVHPCSKGIPVRYSRPDSMMVM